MSQHIGTANEVQTAFEVLRRFVRRRGPEERCDLCSAPLAAEHAHLVEPANRKLLCSCQACALLFSDRQDARYRRVPEEVQFLPDLRLSDAHWEDLHIPINLAFFFHCTPAGRVIAIYPSPAGAMESLLTLEAWQTLVDENPVLRELKPDVEALLVNRVGVARDHYRVPIDHCYKLVWIIRSNWRGLAGGTEVWQAIARFFDGLKERSGPHA